MSLSTWAMVCPAAFTEPISGSVIAPATSTVNSPLSSGCDQTATFRMSPWPIW